MYYYVLVFIFLNTALFSQENLVKNGCFEDTLACPTIIGGIELALFWENPTTNGSPDLFHTCCTIPSLSIPNNGAGSQYPFCTEAYAGIYVFNKPFPLSREYIQTQLKNKLEKTKKYCVSFYVSLSDNSEYAIKTIGVFFSENKITSNWLFYFEPQIVNKSHIIIDKKNWTKIEGIFIAEGNENWITIGNFNSDEFIDTLYVGSQVWSNRASYYYIDDVSVVLCEDTLPVPSDTFYLHIPNVFTPNADGKNDTWQVKANGVQQLHAAVYNRWGSLLWQQEVQATDTTNQTLTLSWDRRSNSGLPASAGTYYYLVTCTTKEGEIKKEKGFLTLVR